MYKKIIFTELFLYMGMNKDFSLAMLKYDKQDRQGKAAFNERSPHPTQQQAPAASSPG
jgi:hypothetical protein